MLWEGAEITEGATDGATPRACVLFLLVQVSRVRGGAVRTPQKTRRATRLGQRQQRHLPDPRTRRQPGRFGRLHVMVRVLLVQGANLTYLGKREPAIYGSTTPAELDARLHAHAEAHGYELEIFYTNHEGAAIERIYEAADDGVDGLVMNPAGFTYAGYALRDCVKGAGLPYVEIHISNIAARNIHCVLSDVSVGLITGFGLHGYILALDAMLEILDRNSSS
jgi:3-dehydroquinate dehydratase-2